MKLKSRELKMLRLIAVDGEFGTRPSLFPWENRQERRLLSLGLVRQDANDWLYATPAGLAALNHPQEQKGGS